MQIFGLYGKSGTGKSHRASEVVDLYQIDAVIDDGILIRNKMRVAGESAKNERTLFAATKRAIFFSDDHRDAVHEAIGKAGIQRLLIIGTSQKMIRTIARRLELPGDIHWIPIQSFQTEEELKIATERRRHGYHVIPVRPVEVEKTYYGSWFRKLVIGFGRRKEEVTLVKPEYLSGKITIHPSCFRDIVSVLLLPTLQLHAVRVKNDTVVITLSLVEGCTIQDLLQWQKLCAEMLSFMMGVPYYIDLEWRSIFPAKRSRNSHDLEAKKLNQKTSV